MGLVNSKRADTVEAVVNSLLDNKTSTSKTAALKSMLTDENVLHGLVKHEGPDVLENILETAKRRLLTKGGPEHCKVGLDTRETIAVPMLRQLDACRLQ